MVVCLHCLRIQAMMWTTCLLFLHQDIVPSLVEATSSRNTSMLHQHIHIITKSLFHQQHHSHTPAWPTRHPPASPTQSRTTQPQSGAQRPNTATTAGAPPAPLPADALHSQHTMRNSPPTSQNYRLLISAKLPVSSRIYANM